MASPSGVSWTELGVYGTKRQGSFTEYLQARFLDDDVRDVRDQAMSPICPRNSRRAEFGRNILQEVNGLLRSD